MSTNIFRKKNIDRVNSPEELHDYVRVTTPAVWLLLIAIIALLAGACIWGTFGLVSRTLHLTAFVEEGRVCVYVPEEDIAHIKVGNSMTVAGTFCTIKSVADDSMPIRYYLEQFFDDGYNYDNLVEDPEQKVFRVSADTEIQNGMYAASLVIEEVHPISFLLN